METTLTRKGQVTIPKHIRDSLSLEPGCKLIFDVNNDGELVLRKDGPLEKGDQIALIARSVPLKSSWVAPPMNIWSFSAAIPMILLDANVILDVWDPDPIWHAWSSSQLRRLSRLHELAINPIVYAEISVSFATPAALDEKLESMGVIVESIPRKAAFLAGKAFVLYRRQRGTKRNVLPDFFIGPTPPCWAARFLPGIRGATRPIFPVCG